MHSLIEKDAIWMMYNAENADPYFEKFVTNKTVVSTVAIITSKKKFLITHSLDYSNLDDFDGEILVYSGENSLIENIFKVLKSINYPKTIYLNYSDKLDVQTDVLGHGVFQFLYDNISNYYMRNNISIPKFKSADEIIYTLMDTKNDNDIKYLKIAANRALEILNTTFKKIKIGMSEKQIVSLVHNIFKFKPHYFKKYGIVKEELSWEKDLCPIVLVGNNLKKGGHSKASDNILKRGQTIYFDFGVKIFLSNGKKYSSDIQRMGYVLNISESHPPKNIQKIFQTLVEAIDLGIQNLTPNRKGYEIDEIVRKHITDNGFPDYNHSTGHPIGELAHNPGTSISPRGHKRSSFKLCKNGVYTIEPRIQIENGGSIEEMVLVTEQGGVTLCPAQKKLYIIK